MAPETPRGPSSKLLTMKFMQRAAAASSSNSPASDPPSSKKRKLESPSQGRMQDDFDQASIQAALNDQEAKRRAALAQHASADTEWVLKSSVNGNRKQGAASAPLNVVYVGYGGLDSGEEDGDGEDAPQSGRTSTKKHKRTSAEASKNGQATSVGEDDQSDESSSDADDDDERQLKRKFDASTRSSDSRSRSRSIPRREDAKAKEFRDKRKKKEVRLNKITSISSGGGSSAGTKPTANGKSITCFKCQEPGHMAADCPNRKAKGPGRNR